MLYIVTEYAPQGEIFGKSKVNLKFYFYFSTLKALSA